MTDAPTDVLTVSPRSGNAARAMPQSRRQASPRRPVALLVLLLGACLLAALALVLLAGHLLDGLGADGWPLQVWMNGEQVGGDWRDLLASTRLDNGTSLVSGLLLLAALAVGLPLLLGLTVALPLLLVGLVLLGVAAGLVALLGLPLLLLGLVALPLLVPLLLLWWLLRWLVG
jgi:hypothetical protein